MELTYIIDKKYDLSFCQNEKEREIAAAVYDSSLKIMEEAKKLYQSAWNEINNDFSRYIANETGYDWFYNNYECVISAIHSGLSNWGDAPKIVRGFQENHYTQRRITAFELIISHCFEIYNHHFQDYKLTQKQVWALAESTALFLTSFTQTGKNFWPWDMSEYYMDNTYPELVEYQKKLKPIFLDRKNFQKYWLKGLAEAQKLDLK